MTSAGAGNTSTWSIGWRTVAPSTVRSTSGGYRPRRRPARRVRSDRARSGSGRRLPPRRVPRRSGLRRRRRPPPPAPAGDRHRRRLPAERAPHRVHHQRAGADVEPATSSTAARPRGASSRRTRSAPTASCAGEGAEHQQDRPRDARPRRRVRAFTYKPRLAGVAADLGLVDALALQSMYIFKQPHIGGEVGCHQDATFLYTDPMTVTGFWFAIEDATLENGCLWAAPGGHRGPLRKVFKRNASQRRHRVRAARRHPAARTATGRRRSCRSRYRPARWSCCTACSPTGATSTVADEPARVLAALHLRHGRLPRRGTGCSARRTAAAPPR